VVSYLKTAISKINTSYWVNILVEILGL
jgi:hypothetical protein